MRRPCGVAVVVVLAAVACHRQPKAVIEYGETVTYTSTADDPAPQPVAPAPVGATAAAVAAAPADDAPDMPAEPAETVDSAAPVNEGGWTTSVRTAAPPPAPATPSESDQPSPPPRAQWYKAKPW